MSLPENSQTKTKMFHSNNTNEPLFQLIYIIDHQNLTDINKFSVIEQKGRASNSMQHTLSLCQKLESNFFLFKIPCHDTKTTEAI